VVVVVVAVVVEAGVAPAAAAPVGPVEAAVAEAAVEVAAVTTAVAIEVPSHQVLASHFRTGADRPRGFRHPRELLGSLAHIRDTGPASANATPRSVCAVQVRFDGSGALTRRLSKTIRLRRRRERLCLAFRLGLGGGQRAEHGQHGIQVGEAGAKTVDEITE
jgi:hypothetical protein